MIITRFGDIYASAYQLPLLKGDQPQESTYRPVTAQVSGAGGEFDFYGENVFPLNPKEYEIKGRLQSTTYAGITDELYDLQSNLLGQGRSKLWFETRDTGADIPLLWAYAKCISVRKTGEKAGENYVDFPVSMIFRISEGLIYGNTQQSESDDEHFHFDVVNRGNYTFTPININVSVPAGGIPITFVRARRVEGFIIPAPTSYYTWVADGPSVQWSNPNENGPGALEELDILSDALSVQLEGSNAYADSSGNALVALGTGQVAWWTTEIANYDGPSDEGQFGECVAIGGSPITNVANTTPIQITSSQSHGLSTNNVVRIIGTGITDGTFIVTYINATTFSLNGTAASGTATTGRWRLGGAISAITVATPPVITTAVNHGLSNDDMVAIFGAPDNGIATANGVWRIANVTANTFTIYEEITGTPYPAINPASYTSGAYYYPSPGAIITAEWYETFV
jgi:hypothetical protein